MNRKKKEVTIYDIAEQLNISVSTVSRALSDHPAVNAKTKKKIVELAEQHGYQANNFARNLRRQRTKTIGVIVPRLNSYFMATVISGIEHIAYEAGYNLIISQSSESPERERAIAKTMFDSRVDGLLVSLSCHTENLRHFDRFLQKDVPVMFFDRTAETSHFPSIKINNVQAGYEATKHLLEQGCRSILHVTISKTHSIYLDRYNGYARALREYGISVEPDLLYLCDLSFEAGMQAARHVMAMPARPDGIFVANDNCAAACMITLKNEGVHIPRDIAVVGFNNDPVCRVIEPNLSTIQYPGYEMGEITARSLIEHLSGASDLMLTQDIVLRSGLAVRASSLKEE
jgi:LacI family transcriptional regulator